MILAIVFFIIGCILFGISYYSTTKKAPTRMLEYTMPLAKSAQLAIVISAFISILNCFR